MMWKTKEIYNAYVYKKWQPEKEFRGNYPEWPLVDRMGDSWVSRIVFCALYFLFYLNFATAWWLWLLLPFHFIIGPLHGAIVNWCGHKYGYSNFNNDDHSKNTLVFDFLMLGELFQNNHHKHPNKPNFAYRWFEFDPVYPVMKVFSYLGIIRLRKTPDIPVSQIK